MKPLRSWGLLRTFRPTDALIDFVCCCSAAVQLLNEEYATLSPDSLESFGFLTSVAKDPGLSDTQKKVFGNSRRLNLFALRLHLYSCYFSI